MIHADVLVSMATPKGKSSLYHTHLLLHSSGGWGGGKSNSYKIKLHEAATYSYLTIKVRSPPIFKLVNLGFQSFFWSHP